MPSVHQQSRKFLEGVFLFSSISLFLKVVTDLLQDKNFVRAQEFFVKVFCARERTRVDCGMLYNSYIYKCIEYLLYISEFVLLAKTGDLLLRTPHL